MTISRVAVGILGGIAAGFAGLVGVVSLTRIAGDYLGFPPGLEWTFTGAVDVASVAGGIMWTAFDGPVRRIGRPMNIVCTVVSGVGVGLDHATHAGRELRDAGVAFEFDQWPWIAFAAGLFVPALATWILHALSIIFDTSRAGAGQVGDRQEPHRQASDRQAGDSQGANRQAVITRVGDRQDTAIVARQPTPGDRQASLPAGDQVGDRQGPDRQVADRQAGDLLSAHRQAGAAKQAAPAATRASAHSPARVLAAVPEPRLPWMTDKLIGAVVTARRNDSTYGRGQVARDHNISPAKARSLIDYIDKHGLMRETA
jgi:hypothetical protein